jgi:Fe2+ or Zn2+ uptake regulation protein
MITEIKGPREKITCQKKTILDFLKSVRTHPTAEEIYQAVKTKLPQISKGTVYRNLNFLAREGKILEIFSNKVSHYDGDISFHSHFICRKCGKIFDIFNNFQKMTP